MDFDGVGRLDRLLLTHPIVGFLLILGMYAAVCAVIGATSGHWPWTFLMPIGAGNALVGIWKAHRNQRRLPRP
jgi:hypothetical protein